MSDPAVALLIMLESVSPDVAGSLLHASECIVAVCSRVQLRDKISQHPALARTHARSHAHTHARTHARKDALSCIHTCMHERTHAHDPRTLPTHIPTQRTHTSRALLRAINRDCLDWQLRGMLPLMTSRTVDSGVVPHTMCEPGVSDIGAVVGSYSADHRVDNSGELPHISCIPERAK